MANLFNLDVINTEGFRWAMLLTAVESVGDFSLKKYAMTNEPIFIGTASGAYMGLVYVLQRALRTSKLSSTNALWNGMTNITNTIIGVSLGEKMEPREYIGIGLITLGILLVDGNAMV